MEDTDNNEVTLVLTQLAEGGEGGDNSNAKIKNEDGIVLATPKIEEDNTVFCVEVPLIDDDDLIKKIIRIKNKDTPPSPQQQSSQYLEFQCFYDNCLIGNAVQCRE